MLKKMVTLNMIRNIPSLSKYIALIFLLLSLACKTILTERRGRIDCPWPDKLRFFKTHQTRIDSVLKIYITSRRRTLNYADYCAYDHLSSTKKYSYVVVYDNVGNHIPPSLMMMSKKKI